MELSRLVLRKALERIAPFIGGIKSSQDHQSVSIRWTSSQLVLSAHHPSGAKCSITVPTAPTSCEVVGSVCHRSLLGKCKVLPDDQLSLTVHNNCLCVSANRIRCQWPLGQAIDPIVVTDGVVAKGLGSSAQRLLQAVKKAKTVSFRSDSQHIHLDATAGPVDAFASCKANKADINCAVSSIDIRRAIKAIGSDDIAISQVDNAIILQSADTIISLPTLPPAPSKREPMQQLRAISTTWTVDPVAIADMIDSKGGTISLKPGRRHVSATYNNDGMTSSAKIKGSCERMELEATSLRDSIRSAGQDAQISSDKIRCYVASGQEFLAVIN